MQENRTQDTAVQANIAKDNAAPETAVQHNTTQEIAVHGATAQEVAAVETDVQETVLQEATAQEATAQEATSQEVATPSKPTNARVCITLQFNGTRYHGFQVQQNALSVCEVLQNALERLYGTRPPVKGCSRTDAGVHALGFCVSYVQPKAIDTFRLPIAVNRFLPLDIRVIAARKVADDFHARYSAVSKEYIYRLHSSAVDDVFAREVTWRLATPLDIAVMQQAAQLLCGTHDYTAFMSAGNKTQDAVRTVHFFRVEQNGRDITFHICADGYLYNMVRILVGTVVEVGAHRMTLQQTQQVLAGRDRAKAGDTAPARGLFLYRVNYDDEPISEK